MLFNFFLGSQNQQILGVIPFCKLQNDNSQMVKTNDENQSEKITTDLFLVELCCFDTTAKWSKMMKNEVKS